jgi:uncharacterized repeat protein (TIGR03803 family)
MTGRPSLVLFHAVCLFAAALVLAGAASAQVSEQLIFSFTGNFGNLPLSPLLRDASGRLYGTTLEGGKESSQCGTRGCGLVFELVPKVGGWSYRGLYPFHGDDGYGPSGSLVFDAAGNLYGITQNGGANDLGAVFKLSPAAGKWTETLIHSFGGAPDGSFPVSGLTEDAAGNLYGTTSGGGASASGSVYKLTPNSDGSWTETVIYSFGGMPDGRLPAAEVVLDSKGNLYGTTEGGGASNLGTVFELSLASGVWTESVLHSFSGSPDDLGQPEAPLCMDSAGDLFGTAAGGLGAAFELVRNSDGSWTETQLHGFGVLHDGFEPISGLVPGGGGSLYGTTYGGGTHGSGTVYELRPGSGGRWTENVIYNFGYDTGDGEGPATTVTFGNNALYGTTSAGGSSAEGAVFQITP